MEIDMNFLEKELGGSCATVCHAEKEYDRTYLPLETAENLSTKIASSSNETNITTKDLIKTVPTNRYQNYTEHVQSIDSSVIKFNEKMEKDLARKNDSIDKVLLALNDSIVKSEIDSVLVLNETSIDTTEELVQIQPSVVEVKEEIKQEEPLEDTIPESKVESIEKDLDKIVFPNINFAFSKADIDNKGEEDIKVVVKYLKKNPILKIELHGYSDSIGTVEYNLYLSQLRAKKVKEILVRNGIEISRIKVKGFGESKSQKPNLNSQERDQNRRVEFVILDKENIAKNILRQAQNDI
jgi:outer membrane protein OmpA-like peptidoglycan-associated protein